jgi:hypothetical protein
MPIPHEIPLEQALTPERWPIPQKHWPVRTGLAFRLLVAHVGLGWQWVRPGGHHLNVLTGSLALESRFLEAPELADAAPRCTPTAEALPLAASMLEDVPDFTRSHAHAQRVLAEVAADGVQVEVTSVGAPGHEGRRWEHAVRLTRGDGIVTGESVRHGPWDELPLAMWTAVLQHRQVLAID